MFLPPRAPQQHAFTFSSTPGFPTAQPATASAADAFDPFNPAAAAAFNIDSTTQPQRRGSESHQRRGSESHRLSEEIAFDPFALDALSAAVPVEDEEVKDAVHEVDAEVSSQGRPSEQEDGPPVDVHAFLSMREQQLVSGERYTIVYPSKTRLGLLLERKDEWVPGCPQRAERAVVRMVVADTESEIRGVTAGSKVVSVNGASMLSVSYSEVLETVRRAPRPVTIEFERAPPVKPSDEISVRVQFSVRTLRILCLVADRQPFLGQFVLQGEGFFKISRSPYAPSTMAEWEPMYFVIGGPIAKPNVLQVYGSKQDFEDTVVALFRKEKITTHVQVFKLDMQCKLSVIKEKRYGAQVVRFFSLKPPTYKFKAIKIAVNRDFEQLRKLHAQMSRFTTAA